MFLRSTPRGNGASGDLGEISLADLERHQIQRLLETKADLGTVAKISRRRPHHALAKDPCYGLRK